MPISRIESNSIAPSQTLTTPIIATTMGVGGATPAGSGSGITFPATQSGSTDANTLDDYEEGTFTPNWRTVSGGNITISNGYAFYVKVGRIVYIKLGWFDSSTNASSWSGPIRFDLPIAAYVPAGGRRDMSATIASIAVFATRGQDAFFIVDSGSYADCYSQDTSTAWNTPTYSGNQAGGSYLHVSLTYQANT